MVDDTATEVAQAISELTEQAQKDALTAVDQSGALKERSMVRSGSVTLPSRIRFYRSRGGGEAWLPTAQLTHHLAKRHPILEGDPLSGTAVFVREYTGPVKTPIEKTCEVCKEKVGVTKVFFHEFDYVGHMEHKHPREYRIMQDETKAVTGGDVAAALMAMSTQDRAAIRMLLGGEDAKQETTGKVKCEACGKSVKSRGLAIHQGRYCSARVVAGVGAESA